MVMASSGSGGLAATADHGSGIPLDGGLEAVAIAGSGDEANLAMMLEAGIVDINGVDPMAGMPALFWAGVGNHASCMALLLEHGADTEAKNTVRLIFNTICTIMGNHDRECG